LSGSPQCFFAEPNLQFDAGVSIDHEQRRREHSRIRSIIATVCLVGRHIPQGKHGQMRRIETGSQCNVLFKVADGSTVAFSQFLRFLRTCRVLSNRVTYVTVAHIWHKHSIGRETVAFDTLRAIIEHLACVCFGWPPVVCDATQKFLDQLEEHYVQAPVSAGDRVLHNLTQPHVIQCLQKYDPHLRKSFLRATKGDFRTASMSQPPFRWNCCFHYLFIQLPC
jgi:hypothetical protein